MGLRNHSLTLQPQFSSRDRVRAHLFVHGVLVGVPKGELLWAPGKLKEVRKNVGNKEYMNSEWADFQVWKFLPPKV